MADEYLTPRDLAARFKIPVSTLEYWRAVREGPNWHKIGRVVRYRVADVEVWEERQRERSA